jgi:hypothetical protein
MKLKSLQPVTTRYQAERFSSHQRRRLDPEENILKPHYIGEQV